MTIQNSASFDKTSSWRTAIFHNCLLERELSRRKEGPRLERETTLYLCVVFVFGNGLVFSCPSGYKRPSKCRREKKIQRFVWNSNWAYVSGLIDSRNNRIVFFLNFKQQTLSMTSQFRIQAYYCGVCVIVGLIFWYLRTNHRTFLCCVNKSTSHRIFRGLM